MSGSVLGKILSASRRRQELWNAAPAEVHAGDVLDLTNRLEDLYAERRRSVARKKFGTSDAIVRRARIEQELEKLMRSD